MPVHARTWVRARVAVRSILGRPASTAAVAVAAAVTLATASPAMAAFTVTPITWDVIGLDSNRPLTAGPELFPSGARVCSDVPATNVQVDFTWPDGNGSGWDFGPGDPYINLRPDSLTSLLFPSIGAGECVDAYFEIRITRSALAFEQTREYVITADDGMSSASTPSPRQIYIERLVSQSRNTTTQIRYGELADQSDWSTLAYGGTINFAIGNEYYIELTTETATAYEQLQSFLTLSNTIFQVIEVETTYDTQTAPPSQVPSPNPSLYADGCVWDEDPGSPNYLSCVATGKAGGTVVTTYRIRIISGGGDEVTLSALIYDYSGSSFHYNADFSTPQGQLITYDPSDSGFEKRFIPDTIGAGGTSLLRFTITNPNPVAITGYNFLDTLPAGVLVAAPANASTTCGGTVTAVSGTDEVALAGGTVGAGGSCSVLVSVTAALTGVYVNVSDNLFIGEADTGNNATDTLTVSASPPPVLDCDENATLALWQFPLAASATAPLPSSNLVTATAGIGAGISGTTSIDTANNDTGGSWYTDNVNTGALNTANAEYFEFVIDTTGLDSITLDFASRRTVQGPQNLRLFYGATGTETASTIYSIGASAVWIAQGPTVLSTGLNSSGNTVFRLYVYNANQNNNGHAAMLDGVRFRGLYCDEITPPPPTGESPPTVSKSFSPDPIAIGQTSTLTFTITNPNLAAALSGIALRDELPFGMDVAPGTFGGTCTGFWGTDPGDAGVLVHSGGSLAANSSCTLTVDVTSSTVGTALNISDPIYATQSGYNTNPTTGIAQDTLTVLDDPSIAKEFVPDLVLLGVTPNDASTLTFTIANPNGGHSISGVSFTDSLPAGLEVALPPNASTSGCGAPTWAPSAGNTVLTFSGGSIAAGGSCTVSVDVTGPVGSYDNVSSAASHIVNGSPSSNGIPAEDSLLIDEPIPGIALRKQVGPGSDPDNDPWSDYLAVEAGDDVYYKITVENTGELPLTGLVVSDPDVDLSGCVWPDPLPVADAFDSHIVTCVVGPVTAAGLTHVNTATAGASSTSGPVEDEDSATYAVAALDIEKAASPLTYTMSGENILYTFTVTNTGAAILPGPVTITDPLVPGATCPALTTIGNLDAFFDPAEEIECSGNYTTQPSDVMNGSIVNTAYASAGGIDSPTDQATVTGPAPADADLSVAKSDSGTTVQQGGTVTYTIQVDNDGPADATGVTVVDVLDADTTYVSDTGGCVQAPMGTLTCSIGALASGASTSFTVTVDVSATAPTAGVLEAGPCNGSEDLCNNVSISGDQDDPVPGNDSDSEPTDVEPAPSADLSVAKSDSGTTVQQGGTVTYTIQVDNDGPADATGVTVVDVLDADTTYVSDTGGCVQAPMGTLTCSIGALASGASTSFTVTVDVSATAPTAGVLEAGPCNGSEDLCNNVSISGDQDDPVPGNDSDSEPTDVEPAPASADLSIVKTGPASAVEQGAFMTYEITVTNGGPDSAANVHVVDTLDPSTTYFASSRPCIEGPVGVIDCDLGDIANGASVVFTVVVHVDGAAPTAGMGAGTPCSGGEDLCNVATVTSDTSDPDPSDDTTDVGTDVVAPVDVAALRLTKIDITPEPVAPGSSVTYEISVTNDGPATATGVVVHETLDPFMSYVSDNVPGGCTLTDPGDGVTTGPTLECPLGDIAATTTVTFQIVVDLSASAPTSSGDQDGDCLGTEDVCNEAAVSTTSSDAVIDDNSDSEPTDVLVPVLCGNGALDQGEQCDPPSGEICNNGIDDDGDMAIDCADTECLIPGYQSCDAACQLTTACVPILDDPALITGERIRVHGKYIPTTTVDPVADGFMFLLTNENGVIYRGRLLPGDIKLVSSGRRPRWGFKDLAAKKGTGSRDGIFKFQLRVHREPDGSTSYPFFVRVYGDMSFATEKRMTTQVYIGDDVGHLTAEWLGQQGRWFLTHKQAEGGR